MEGRCHVEGAGAAQRGPPQASAKWTVRMAQTVTAHSLSSEDLDCMREGHTGRWGGRAAALQEAAPRQEAPGDRPLTRLGTTNTLRDLQAPSQGRPQ